MLGGAVAAPVSVAGFGAIYSLLALLYLDLYMNWPLLERPWVDWSILTSMVVLFLLLGILPFIDNFSNIGGFVCGTVTGLILVPRISFGKWDRRRKIIALCLAVPTLFVMYFLAFWYFYAGDTFNSCSWCQVIDCVPQGTSWCAGSA